MLVFLFRLLSRLPLQALHVLGAGLGWLVFLAVPSYRQRLRENIGRAGFAASQRSAIAESGKSILELPFVWCASPDRVQACVKMENWELVQAALDTGRGVIFLTPHLGCFEIIAQAIAIRIPLTVLYRPPRKQALKPLIEVARARHNLALAPANLSGVRMLAKALKKGLPIGLLPDQAPQSGEGVWADFFGRAAYTMTLPAKLHQMTGSPIILSFAERLPCGLGYTVRFVAFDEPFGGDTGQQANAINQAMEQLIACCPAQYFWSYNRYKVPSGVAAPETFSAPQENS